MAIINNIHNEFRPHVKSLCSFITHLIINYDNDNHEEYGLLENINYVTVAINNSIIGLMTDRTKKIIDDETPDNLILFNQIWTFNPDNIDPDPHFDKYNIVGCISKTPFDIYAKTEDQFADPFFIHTDIQNDSSYRITFGCGPLGFYINNIKIREDEFEDQLFLFVSSCVMIVRKLISIQIIKSVEARSEEDDIDITTIIDDEELREDIFDNMANILNDDSINGLFYSSITRNIDNGRSSLVSKSGKSLLTLYNGDEYLIPTLKKYYMEHMNKEQSKEELDSDGKAEMTANMIEERDMIINKKEIDHIILDEDMRSELSKLFKSLDGYEGTYSLNAIMPIDADEGGNTIYHKFMLLLIYDCETEYSIFSNYDLIIDDDIREPFQKVQNYLIQTYIRNGLPIDFVDEYEKKFNELNIMDQVNESIDEEELKEDEDDIDNDEQIIEKDDKKNKINIISYNKPKEEFSVIEFSELVEDKLDGFFKEIETQLQFNISDYDSIAKVLRSLSNCNSREYYSDNNAIDFDYIGEAISSDSFVITIASHDGHSIIDSIVVFFDDDENKYVAYRMGDKFGKYSSLEDRKKFYRYYHIEESLVSLNITYKGGSFNLALDQLCDYLGIDSLSYNESDFRARYNICTWVLSTISNLFTRKYIYKCRGLDLKYNNPDHHKYMNQFDTYNASKIISCFEHYVDNHMIDSYDIDNILNTFNFRKDYDKKSDYIEIENESNKVSVTLFDGTWSYINDNAEIIVKRPNKYLTDPGYYFSLKTARDNDWNYLLSIDSLGDKNIQDFNKEMINILKYTKMCIEDASNSKTTKRKTKRK